MKTTNFFFAAVIIMITMMFSNSANAQSYTLTLPTGITKNVLLDESSGSNLDPGKKIIIEFSQPVDLSVTSLNNTLTFSNSVLVKGTDNISTTFTSTSKISVKVMILTNTGANSDATIKLTAVKNTSVYTAIKSSGSSLPCDTTTAHNNGYNAGFAAGKATCGTTKTEILKSEVISSVYPNPTTGNTTVSYDNYTTTTDLSDLATGMYFINILNINGQVVKTEKLVKE